MNIKYVIRFVGSAVRAGSALKALGKTRRENDRLLMLEAAVNVVGAAVAVALIVREIRQDRDTDARVVELEDRK